MPNNGNISIVDASLNSKNKNTVFGLKVVEKDVYLKYPAIKNVINNINWVINLLENLCSSQELFDFWYLKEANDFMEYQRVGHRENYSKQDDRLFPLESVAIQGFNTNHDASVEKVTIHTGFSANEYARSFNALAITVGMDIYFRNNAYKPETEEGRKTLAHELAHVAQYEEDRITQNTSREELETEANLVEHKEDYNSDPLVTLNINGNRYRFPKSKMKYYAHKVAMNIRKWVSEQKLLLDEEEYLRFLCAYKEWLELRV